MFFCLPDVGCAVAFASCLNKDSISGMCPPPILDETSSRPLEIPFDHPKDYKETNTRYTACSVQLFDEPLCVQLMGRSPIYTHQLPLLLCPGLHGVARMV